MKRRLPVLPTIIVAAAIAAMIALGVWQLARLKEKEALLASFDAAMSNPAILQGLPRGGDEQSVLYRKVRFDCPVVDGWRAIAGRSAQNQTGYVQIAHCSFPQAEGLDAEVVVGWSRDLAQPEWEGGEVSGTITRGGVAAYHVVADPPLAGLEANAQPDPSDTPNNHLAYAGQWFFFALCALVIYNLALRKRWQGEA